MIDGRNIRKSMLSYEGGQTKLEESSTLSPSTFGIQMPFSLSDSVNLISFSLSQMALLKVFQLLKKNFNIPRNQSSHWHPRNWSASCSCCTENLKAFHYILQHENNHVGNNTAVFKVHMNHIEYARNIPSCFQGRSALLDSMHENKTVCTRPNNNR